jgi:ABC-type Fe3+ transport system substrate-binding protein
MGSKPLLSSLALGVSLALVAGSAIAATNQEIAQLKGPDRTKVLYEGAKKEGKAVMYSPINVEATIRPLAAAFAKKYPGVAFETWRGGTVETLQKIGAEIQAKNQFADLVEGGSGAVPAIKGNMVEAFYSPSLDQYDKAHLDPRGLWAPSRVAYMGFAYNTKVIPDAEVPKTFDDLLNSKLKGKMVWVASTDPGAPLFIANLLQTRGKEKTEEYLKKLSAQDVTAFPQDLNNMTNRVAQGEYGLAIHSTAHDPVRMHGQGAPINVQMMDPIPGLINAIQLVRGAPHPHAAMLFMDFFMDQEGQKILSDTGYDSVHPKVEPSPDMRKIVPRFAGMKEYVVTPEAIFDTRDVTHELYQKYMDK